MSRRRPTPGRVGDLEPGESQSYWERSVLRGQGDFCGIPRHDMYECDLFEQAANAWNENGDNFFFRKFNKLGKWFFDG